MNNLIEQTKPTYCKNPIPTDKGWVDGDTGELLVVVKGLMSLVEPPAPVKRGRGRPRKYPRPDGSM